MDRPGYHLHTRSPSVRTLAWSETWRPVSCFYSSVPSLAGPAYCHLRTFPLPGRHEAAYSQDRTSGDMNDEDYKSLLTWRMVPVCVRSKVSVPKETYSLAVTKFWGNGVGSGLRLTAGGLYGDWRDRRAMAVLRLKRLSFLGDEGGIWHLGSILLWHVSLCSSVWSF